MFEVSLLIGPPGSGKSLLGEKLLQTYPSNYVGFVNVGAQLRAQGRLVEEYMARPTVGGKALLREKAKELLRSGLDAAIEADRQGCARGGVAGRRKRGAADRGETAPH